MPVRNFIKNTLRSLNGLLFSGVISRLLSKLPKYPTVFVLILVNLIPLYGVIYWGWDQDYILFIYWAETSIIGLFNVFRMLLAKKVDTKGIRVNGKRPVVKTKKQFLKFRVSLVLFFIMHFGIFNLVHGLFVTSITDLGIEEILDSVDIYQILRQLSWLIIPTVALFLSHAASFFFNYIGRREYERQELNALFLKPYSRIVVTHITLVVGANLVDALDNKLAFIALMVVLKIFFDVLSHIFAHENLKHPKLSIG